MLPMIVPHSLDLATPFFPNSLSFSQSYLKTCFSTAFPFRTHLLAGVQGPVYMKERCPGMEGYPPSRVNFSNGLCEHS